MKKFLIVLTTLLLAMLAACSGNDNNESAETDELLMIEVDFIVPEQVDVGETVELKAEVTYGDELVTDAKVVFEVWELGDEENSEKLDGTNNDDGTYTVDYTFDRDGIFEMYAHTDAKHQHVMPLKQITVGEGGEYEDVDGHVAFHTEGFDLHFMNPESVQVGEEMELTAHITLHDEPLENAQVRYEIALTDSEETTLLDGELLNDGSYSATHTFDEAGTYSIQVHVEDDADLHEHATYEIEVTE